MKMDLQNEAFALAFQLVDATDTTVYLTGKAGTGKTTFLKYLKENSRKKMIVLAPTGVAAINAGGVTMHSFFQLPFKPFVANAPMGFGRNEQLINRNEMLRNLRFNNNKRKIIAELELIVMDEVSMLRSDMLEAIHCILQSARKNNLPFGGIQILFIGDLHQLPPVVVDSEKAVLDSYYDSPFFFDAPIMQQVKPLYIELKKIYRQNETAFIDLLNHIRHNQMNEDDYQLLQSRYKPHFQPDDDFYITITSHNSKADTINNAALKKLTTPIYTYSGRLQGDYSDKQLPTEKNLQLKVGAQVMFIKNDSGEERKFYNGKLATVVDLGEEKIVVCFPDTKETFTVKQESWKNIQYTVDADTHEIEEETIGEFIQYPLRLAWAITIHKSQGLTFDRAIVDAGDSFAPGQVYVALSRCTNLEGLVLKSRITDKAIFSDERIETFSQQESNLSVIKNSLQNLKQNFQFNQLQKTFDWTSIIHATELFHDETRQHKTLHKDKSILDAVVKLLQTVKEQKEVTDKFLIEFVGLKQEALINNNPKILLDRCNKAIQYFSNALFSDVAKPLGILIKQVEEVTKAKKYRTIITHYETTIWNKIESLHQVEWDQKKISSGNPLPKTPESKPLPKKPAKGDSAKESIIFYLGGKGVEEIATLKKLAISTIESHLAQGILQGEIGIQDFVPSEDLVAIRQAIPDHPPYLLSGIKTRLENRFSFSQIKMAIHHFMFTREIPLEEKNKKVVQEIT